jgi:hypothetical protein
MHPLRIIVRTIVPDRVTDLFDWQLAQLLNMSIDTAVSWLPTCLPHAVAGLTDTEIANYRPLSTVNIHAPLGSVLQTRPLDLVIPTHAFADTLHSLQAQITELQTQVVSLQQQNVELDHRTRGVQPVNLRTFLDAHLFNLGYRLGDSRPAFIHGHVADVARALGVPANLTALYDLYM